MIKTNFLYSILLIISLCSCGGGSADKEKAEESTTQVSDSIVVSQEVIIQPELKTDQDTVEAMSEEVIKDYNINTADSDNTITEELTETDNVTPLPGKSDVDLEQLAKEPITEEGISEEDLADANINALPDHTVWNDLTKKYVTGDGSVDYKRFKSNKKAIEKYIETLTIEGPRDNWSYNVRLAYWINLYNAVTVNLILDNYPLKSIMDINGGKAWDLKLINLAGEDLSLNDIEHNIIRKRFNEPRIHFAVNCAAKSCPKLLNEAFLPEMLERQLEKQTNYFIHNKDKNHISDEKLDISSIFDWYGSDFGDVKTFIGKYEPSINSELAVSFQEYDWSLNELK